MRQEGREHEVQISHGLCQRPEHGRQALAFFGGLELEGLGICNVLVGLADQTHCSGKSGLLAVVTNQVSDLIKARGDGIQQRAIDFLELSRCRNLTELLVDHRGGAINQVAPACHQLAVRAADEFCPSEVRIRGLGASCRNEVAQCISLVATEHVTHIDHNSVRRRELLALHGEEL